MRVLVLILLCWGLAGGEEARRIRVRYVDAQELATLLRDLVPESEARVDDDDLLVRGPALVEELIAECDVYEPSLGLQVRVVAMTTQTRRMMGREVCGPHRSPRSRDDFDVYSLLERSAGQLDDLVFHRLARELCRTSLDLREEAGHVHRPESEQLQNALSAQRQVDGYTTLQVEPQQVLRYFLPDLATRTRAGTAEQLRLKLGDTRGCGTPGRCRRRMLSSS